MLRVEGDADTAIDGEMLAIDFDRDAQRAVYLLRRMDRALGIGSRQEHGKLVPAQSSHRIRGTGRRLEPVGELLEDVIAQIVAERIVQFFEAIKIEQEERAGRVFMAC